MAFVQKAEKARGKYVCSGRKIQAKGISQEVSVMTTAVHGQIRRYYLFYGPEEYLKTAKIKDLINKVVTKGYEDFDCDYLEGRGLDVSLLINTACAPPVASSLRVVIVRHVDKISPKGLELLERFIPKIPEQTTIVMTAEKIDLRKKIFKLLLADKKAGHQFEEPIPSKATELVMEYAQNQTVEISPEAAAYLVETVGCNVGRLEQEVSKLATYVGTGKTIQKTDIADMCGAGLAGTISDLPEKIAAKDIGGASILLSHLLLAKESEGSILYRLKDYFGKLNAIQVYNAAPDMIIRIFGLSDKDRKTAENLSRLARRLSSVAIIDCLGMIYEAEIRLKSGGLGKEIILFELINNLSITLNRE